MGGTAIVHAIDDDEGMRQALDSLFRSVGLQARLHGSAGDHAAAPPVPGPGCLVPDVRLPGLSGLDFQSQLAEAHNRSPVVLMTSHGDIPMSVRAMKAGAVDFLPKPFRDQDMLDDVAAAVERDRQRLSAQAEALDLHARFDTLTPRERHVMTLVTAGRMNKQVAHDLGLSEITVKIHCGAAMRKMQARSLADLVRMAEALQLKVEDVPRRDG